MTDEPESKSHSNKLSGLIGILIALPLLYVLSIGPVALYCQKVPSSFPTVKEYYLPVIWLHDHTVLKKPLEMYIGLWGAH